MSIYSTSSFVSMSTKSIEVTLFNICTLNPSSKSYSISSFGTNAVIENGESGEYCPFLNFHLYANLTNLSSNITGSVPNSVVNVKPIFGAFNGFSLITVISFSCKSTPFICVLPLVPVSADILSVPASNNLKSIIFGSFKLSVKAKNPSKKFMPVIKFSPSNLKTKFPTSLIKVTTEVPS